jgi:transcriptional accessory protein Tex/SPT6
VWKRLLNNSIQTDVRLELKDRSDVEAIRVFRENLQNLLLTALAGMIAVLTVDPGIRTGCKIAVVDDTGKFLDHSVIYPLPPKNDRTEHGAFQSRVQLMAIFGCGPKTFEQAAGFLPSRMIHLPTGPEAQRVWRVVLPLYVLEKDPDHFITRHTGPRF